ncbi:hypothetical protein EXU48_18995 [Occultella glacieicola]|uniref:Uncharacterized protein n=1 Tax=Occultella glacieicola TaxID=2518684 RepID=A0ABY2E470_9MICO|nr:hypothetical protein [Occultella glacieicola]TDE90011.1 hypothetical protein EXU48_18995 [Occultella glacieicola]
MSFLARLKEMFARPEPAPGPGARRPSHAPLPADAGQEDRLREKLAGDPNDVDAFNELAELVRRRAAEVEQPDPLTAETGPIRAQAADTAHWALAEELAGRPTAWYPLVELARLSLLDDKEGAMRRLGAACERDPSGRALVAGVRMLRDAHMPADALGLGVGHWSPADQDAEAGRQVIRAALDAGRPTDARRHLSALAEYGADRPGTAGVVAELEPFVAAAEASTQTS